MSEEFDSVMFTDCKSFRYQVLGSSLCLHCLFLTLHKISTLLAAFEKEFSLSISSNSTGLINERGASWQGTQQSAMQEHVRLILLTAILILCTYLWICSFVQVFSFLVSSNPIYLSNISTFSLPLIRTSNLRVPADQLRRGHRTDSSIFFQTKEGRGRKQWSSLQSWFQP